MSGEVEALVDESGDTGLAATLVVGVPTRLALKGVGVVLGVPGVLASVPTGERVATLFATGGLVGTTVGVAVGCGVGVLVAGGSGVLVMPCRNAPGGSELVGLVVEEVVC